MSVHILEISLSQSMGGDWWRGASVMAARRARTGLQKSTFQVERVLRVDQATSSAATLGLHRFVFRNKKATSTYTCTTSPVPLSSRTRFGPEGRAIGLQRGTSIHCYHYKGALCTCKNRRSYLSKRRYLKRVYEWKFRRRSRYLHA